MTYFCHILSIILVSFDPIFFSCRPNVSPHELSFFTNEKSETHLGKQPRKKSPPKISVSLNSRSESDFLCFNFSLFFFLEHIFPFVIQSFIIVPSSNHASFLFSAANWKLFLVWWQWPRLLLTSHLGKVKYSTELRKEAKKKDEMLPGHQKMVFTLLFIF